MTHIAICFTDSSGTYHKHALVTVASVFDNTKSQICLHIIHDETLREQEKNLFSALCLRHNNRIIFHPVKEISQDITKNVPAFLGKGTLYKILIPDLIQENKILYLDCDIVCLCDVAAIYRMDISGNYIGAVKLNKKQGLAWSKRYGLSSAFCINAGVLLMNLEKIRREIPDYAERLFSIVRDKGIPMGDQGATNIFFDGRADAFALLPEFCNFLLETEDHSVLPLAAYQGKMLHFAGKKPWRVFTPPALYYWKYYASLFPDENVPERMQNLEPYEYAHLFSFLLRHEKLRRWVNRLREAEQDGLASLIRARLFARSRKRRAKAAEAVRSGLTDATP
ncbi:MAG: hypothetical protein LBO77_01735 [Desulfovibrio sp.]|jgi:lipopolysaccharide biosynthesis glycosyltransferase|nr:hypothetical protein [Desulfovibrio sp.]